MSYSSHNCLLNFFWKKYIYIYISASVLLCPTLFLPYYFSGILYFGHAPSGTREAASAELAKRPQRNLRSDFLVFFTKNKHDAATTNNSDNITQKRQSATKHLTLQDAWLIFKKVFLVLLEKTKNAKNAKNAKNIIKKKVY